MVDETHHYDVLVAGAGNAACCAALAASQTGAKAGILQKAHKDERGGNSALTGHMRFVFEGVEDIRPLRCIHADFSLFRNAVRIVLGFPLYGEILAGLV